MRLIKIERPDAIWYFTSQMKAAKFIGCAQCLIDHVLKGVGKSVKGWSVEYTNDENIINKYLNPEL